MIKLKVYGQVDCKILPHDTNVFVGTKWLYNPRFIRDVKPGDNILLNNAWYTVESISWEPMKYFKKGESK